MSIDYLIHKNAYSKTHSSLTYGIMRVSSSYQIINCHNRLYDLYFSLKPKNLLFQIEEYSNEVHAFATDKSLKDNPTKIFISIDDNEARQQNYVDILKQIVNASITLIIPKKLTEHIQSIGLNFDMIVYDTIFNSDVFFPLNIQRNNKILCILSTDKECVSKIETLLYPSTSLPIVLINNPDVSHDQNIGLMFDSDLNFALNTYSAVIDLSNSYRSEISVCGIDSYDINELPNLVINETNKAIQPIEIKEFITKNMLKENNE